MDSDRPNSYGMICHKTNILAIMMKKSLPSQCDSDFLDNVIKRPPTEEYVILMPPSSIKGIKLKKEICDGWPSCLCEYECDWWKNKNIEMVEKNLCDMISIGIKNFEGIDEFKQSREVTYQCINCPDQILVPHHWTTTFPSYRKEFAKLDKHIDSVHGLTLPHSLYNYRRCLDQSLYHKIEEDGRCIWCEKKKSSGQKFTCRLE